METNTLINIFNFSFSLAIVAGWIIWFIRFGVSYIKHRDDVGMFLVLVAATLVVQNVFTGLLELSQITGILHQDTHVFYFFARSIERPLSFFVLVGTFWLSRERQSE